VKAQDIDDWQVISLVGPNSSRYKVYWNENLKKIGYSQLIFGEADFYEVGLEAANIKGIKIRSTKDIKVIAAQYFESDALREFRANAL
jgi:hypothetical protein